MKNDIDLHMHSFYSDDGEFTPAELVRMCHRAGIRVMAISDHNCVKANAEAQKEAEGLNIRYIPAIEIDCTFQGLDLHLLGYQIDYKSSDFETVENNIHRQAREASVESLRLTRQLGFYITEEELNAVSCKGYWKDVWTGEMFAEILLNKPEYQDDELLRPYREGGLRGDNPYVNFYWDYYAQGKPCYVSMTCPSLEEAISIIKDNGGKAVLAHPGNNLKKAAAPLPPGGSSPPSATTSWSEHPRNGRGDTPRFALFDEIVSLGIDGVEAFSSYHDRQVAEYFCREAQKHSLIVTCGSDFHGKTKPLVRLGESGCQHPFKESISCLVNFR